MDDLEEFDKRMLTPEQIENKQKQRKELEKFTLHDNRGQVDDKPIQLGKKKKQE